MPLGLILAATWLEMLTPVEIVSEISHSLGFLTVDLQDLPERHRSLQAIFSTSWQRLSRDEQEIVQKVDLKGARQQAAIAEIAADSENVRTAWQWAVNGVQIDWLTQALHSLGLFYLRESRLREGETMCRLAVERLTLTVPDNKTSIGTCDIQRTPFQPDRVRFGILAFIWLSIFQRHLKQLESAQQTLRQAQVWIAHPLLAGLDIRFEQAQLLLEEAEVIYVTNHEEARALIEQSLTIFRTLSEPWHMAQALDRLGFALLPAGLLARQASDGRKSGVTPSFGRCPRNCPITHVAQHDCQVCRQI
jgi:hypothetical protein